MGCYASKSVMDLTSIRIDIPLKRKLPMYSEISHQRTSNINHSIEPIQVSNEISSNKTDQKNTVSEETILLIKYEIDNPRVDANFLSYGSHTLTDICLKNPRRKKRQCESIMLRVNCI
jgi:hypothetical protein